MKIKRNIFFLTLLLISNCTDENITGPSDFELEKNIIGTWKGYSNYSITFFPDGTFIDSTYMDDNPDTSYNYFALFIRNGKYHISNSVLELSEFYFSEVISKTRTGGSIGSWSAEISISGKVLKRKPVDLFNNTGNNKNDLWDKWDTIEWWCHAEKNDSLWTDYSTTIRSYYFNEDSTNYSVSEQEHYFIKDTTYTHNFKRPFSYDPPNLYAPNEYFSNIYVKFSNNKMYWYYDYVPEDLFKVQ